MESLKDTGNVEMAGERKREVGRDSASSSASVYRLFGRQKSIHQVMGGGRAANVILWKQWRVSCGVIVIATFMWLLFEKSGLPFLSVCSDFLLILVVFLYVRSNYANKQLTELPELVLSEEVIHSAATSFRVKVNNILIMVHDITLGKDFRLFFKVVFCLWLFSVVASVVSLFTLAYIVFTGIIVSVTLPALYSRYEEHVDRFAGIIHRSFSTRYKIVDENDAIRLHQGPPKDKDE